MQSLLLKRDRRQLALLELLMDGDVISMGKISRQTGYPKRTLTEDIKQINTYLAPSRIVAGPEGVALRIPPDSSIRAVYAAVLRQSREYQLMAYLFYNENHSQESIASALFVSVSTLRRMIATMNRILAGRCITIGTAPFSVVGNEEHITQFYNALFSELCPDGRGLIPDERRSVLLEICSRALKDWNLRLSYPSLLNLLILMYVRIVRIQHGHPSLLAPEVPRQLYEGILGDEAMCGLFSAAFGRPLNRELVFQLFPQYLKFGYAREYEDMQALAALCADGIQLLQSIQSAIRQMGDALGISTEGTRELERSLFNALQHQELRQYILYSHSEVFIKGFGRNHAAILEIAKKIVWQQFSKSHRDAAMNEILYLLFTHWPGFVEKIESAVSKIVVGVFFDSDTEHAQLIADIIEQNAKIDLLVFVSELETGEAIDLMCEGVDLLITNIPELNTSCKKTICVQEYPSSLDLQHILMATEETYSHKMAERAEGLMKPQSRTPLP